MHPMVRGGLCDGPHQPEGGINLRGTIHPHRSYMLQS